METEERIRKRDKKERCRKKTGGKGKRIKGEGERK